VDGPAKSESPVNGKHPIIIKVSAILLVVQYEMGFGYVKIAIENDHRNSGFSH